MDIISSAFNIASQEKYIVPLFLFPSKANTHTTPMHTHTHAQTQHERTHACCACAHHAHTHAHTQMVQEQVLKFVVKLAVALHLQTPELEAT